MVGQIIKAGGMNARTGGTLELKYALLRVTFQCASIHCLPVPILSASLASKLVCAISMSGPPNPPVDARLPYNLYCVGGSVKHCTIQSSPKGTPQNFD